MVRPSFHPSKHIQLLYDISFLKLTYTPDPPPACHNLAIIIKDLKIYSNLKYYYSFKAKLNCCSYSRAVAAAKQHHNDEIKYNKR